MIENQFEKVKAHIWEQWKKTLLKKDRPEAKKLLDEHLEDEHNHKEPRQYINNNPVPLSIENEMNRAVYVLVKSGCFSEQSIGRILKMNHRTVKNIFSKLTT